MSQSNFEKIKEYIKGNVGVYELIETIVDGLGKSLISNPAFVSECKRALTPLLDDEDGDGEIDPPTITELAFSATIVYEAYKLHGVKLDIDEKYVQETIIEVLVYLILTSDKLDDRYKKDMVNVVETGLPMAWDLTENLIEKIKKHFQKKGWCKCWCGEEETLKLGQDEEGKSTMERHLHDSVNGRKRVKEIMKKRAENTTSE